MVRGLPDTLDKAHDEILKAHEEIVKTREENARAHDEIERLRQQLAWLKKQIFGQKSERRADGPADELTQDLFAKPAEATAEEIREETSEPAKEPRRRRQARKPLPAGLPRREILHDVAPGEKVCPCCGKEKVRIGEDATEQLEVIPARVYVARHVRPKYACPSCKDGVVQASLPSQPAPRASVGPGFLAWLIVSKYADHLPLCRLERIFARHGIDLPRARMCDWLMTVADLARPLAKAMTTKVRAGPVIQADETSIRLQTNEKKGKTEQAWVWVYVGGDDAPYTIYDFRRGRDQEGPKAMLAGFAGTLQTDAYGAYDAALKPDVGAASLDAAITRAGCWAHARRKFIEAEESGDSRATGVIEWIRELFKVEREWKEQWTAVVAGPAWRDLSPEGKAAERERLFEERRALRREKSKPVVEALRTWMTERLDVLPRSPLGQAIGYAQNQWEPLTRFLDDGRIEIDNNAAERALRPIAVGRKNWLFAGSERGGRAAATFFTLLESARRNGLNPHEYLTDVLTRLPSHPINRIDDLLPDRWTASPTN